MSPNLHSRAGFRSPQPNMPFSLRPWTVPRRIRASGLPIPLLLVILLVVIAAISPSLSPGSSSCLAAPASRSLPTATAVPTAVAGADPVHPVSVDVDARDGRFTFTSSSTPTPTTQWIVAQRQIRASSSTSHHFFFTPTRTPTPDDSPSNGMSTGIRAIGLLLLSFFLIVIFCALRFSASSSPADEVHPSARPRPRRTTDPENSPNTLAPHASHVVTYGNPLATPVYRYTFTSRGAATFLRDYPAAHFPIDSHALHAMQDSPSHWHFLDPGRVLPEFRLLLSPLVHCDLAAQRVKLFADGHPGAPARAESRTRPRALCVQTRLPAPVPPEDARDVDSPYAGFRMPGIVYFEVRITALSSSSSARATTQVAVGLAIGPYPPFRLPGWTKWSMGYFSHSGYLHVGSSTAGQAYGPPFGKGDVVGVGVETNSRVAFYVVNGKRLPMAVELPAGKEAVFPTVGATGPCEFEYNFGSAGEFVWDGRMFEDEPVVRVDEDGWEMAPATWGDAHSGPPPPLHQPNEFVGYVMDVLPAYEE